MRIAQVAPLCESVPPPAYGGIELVVSLLSEALTQRGHEVTLFATGDSQTQASLVPGCERALRSQGTSDMEVLIYHQMQLSRVFAQASEFDIIHSHLDYLTMPLVQLTKTPVVHTLHGAMVPEHEKIFRQHKEQNYVSISTSQRRPDLGINYLATVYNAIAVDNFGFYSQPSDPPYLAFLGRMSPHKGPHLAIKIAQQAGWTLKMAGKVDPCDRVFFKREVEPHIDGDQIQFLGEANHAEKTALLGNAAATLFPITWQEPFGLVMIESMACGTPVIAMALGAAPEIIVDGRTGYLCSTVADGAAAIAKIDRISRQACRRHVEQNFSIRRMVDGYEAIYRQLDQKHTRNGYAKAFVLEPIK